MRPVRGRRSTWRIPLTARGRNSFVTRRSPILRISTASRGICGRSNFHMTKQNRQPLTCDPGSFEAASTVIPDARVRRAACAPAERRASRHPQPRSTTGPLGARTRSVDWWKRIPVTAACACSSVPGRIYVAGCVRVTAARASVCCHSSGTCSSGGSDGSSPEGGSHESSTDAALSVYEGTALHPARPFARGSGKLVGVCVRVRRLDRCAGHCDADLPDATSLGRHSCKQ